MEKQGGKGDRGPDRDPGGLRIPGILMIPVGLMVGWAVGNWLGALLGGVIGFFLWRSRA